MGRLGFVFLALPFGVLYYVESGPAKCFSLIRWPFSTLFTCDVCAVTVVAAAYSTQRMKIKIAHDVLALVALIALCVRVLELLCLSSCGCPVLSPRFFPLAHGSNLQEEKTVLEPCDTSNKTCLFSS